MGGEPAVAPRAPTRRSRLPQCNAPDCAADPVHAFCIRRLSHAGASRSGLTPQFRNDLMAALEDVRCKGQAHVPISFLHKKFKPIGAGSGDSIPSLFLPGHRIPAPLFNDFSSPPTI